MCVEKRAHVFSVIVYTRANTHTHTHTRKHLHRHTYTPATHMIPTVHCYLYTPCTKIGYRDTEHFFWNSSIGVSSFYFKVVEHTHKHTLLLAPTHTHTPTHSQYIVYNMTLLFFSSRFGVHAAMTSH